jgi:hypothetical protein
MEIAPSYFDSDRPIPGGDVRFRAWVRDVLANADDEPA